MNTPDLTMYRLVHRSIRQSTARLTAAVSGVTEAERDDRGRRLARWYQGFENELHTHHTVEDDVFFPALFQRVPALRGHLERIDEEHHHLDELIVASRAAIAGLADPSVAFPDAVAVAVDRTADLESFMDRHLDFEDAEILPLFTRHMDAAEYDELEATALADPKLGELRFTVPWMMANATPDERRHLLDSAPFMMKVLWVATRRGYDRLTAAALGTDVLAPMTAVAS
ncbi:hemerythrin domain-containing protein [Dermatobacter hominis]|uniref:hemerythrin domain-containing protein n=1 Tax=Dermatobacter hominis TaxID=2884263 RepID=UPI001D124F88|nr:hemerythrin domain-containing protein [Dermatobacter hominis]UDY35656.1 hemerythrin domain-containing protein [Dermatobacter hominis]